MTRGRLVIVLGPSGSGKGSLIDYARKLHPEMKAPLNYTTRSIRPGEKDGEHLHFISEREFKDHIERGDFLEWTEFGGHYYGSLKEELLPRLAKGELILDEMDLEGVLRLKKALSPEEIVTIFVDGGPWEEMERRIRARAPISDTELAERRKRYDAEEAFKSKANYVVHNPYGKLAEAQKEFERILNSLSHT